MKGAASENIYKYIYKKIILSWVCPSEKYYIGTA